MNIIVAGQEAGWTRELVHLCKKKDIMVFGETDIISFQDIHLLVTDFPIDATRKGIFSEIPFLVASKTRCEENILAAFAAGAEDYIIRPILPEVAAARIQRILWRYAQWKQEPGKRHEDIHFTPSEYRILSHLMSMPGKVFTRNELIVEALGEGYEGFDRSIDNYIKQIRGKIEENPANPEHIVTVHGIGYKYVP